MASIQLELKPWNSPNFAVVKQKERPRQEGFKPDQSGIPVSELQVDALNELAGQWLSDLYRKAGKKSPWTNLG